MAGTIELYVCKKGQALKDGRLEIGTGIASVGDATFDARERCKREPSIHRIAYYKVDGSDEHRHFFTYENTETPTEHAARPKAAPRAEIAVGARKPTAKPASKPFLAKLLALVTD